MYKYDQSFDELQLPYKDMPLIEDKNYKRHMIIEQIHDYYQPNQSKYVQTQQVFLLILLLNQLLTIFLYEVATNIFIIRKFFIRYPLFYIFAWRFRFLSYIQLSILILCCVALHCYPYQCRKYPFNYYIFIGTFYSRAFVYFYILLYFRNMNSIIFFCIPVFITFFIFFRYKNNQFQLSLFNRYKSELQDYQTQRQLLNIQSNSISLESEDEQISQNSFIYENIFERDLLEPLQHSQGENEQDDNEKNSFEALEDENKYEENEAQEKLSILTDEQRSQMMDQQQEESKNLIIIKRQQEDLEVEEEEDFKIEFGLDKYEEEIRATKQKKEDERIKRQEEQERVMQKQVEKQQQQEQSIVVRQTLEEIMVQRRVLKPKENMKFENSWVLYLLTGFICPIVLLQLFNPLPYLLYMVVIIFAFIHIWILCSHLELYFNQDRSYILHNSWANSYYLSLTYYEADLFFPWIFWMDRTKLRNRNQK